MDFIKHADHHKEHIEGISTNLKQLLEKSDQAIYVYLDDHHKICNKKFAALLGYKSIKEWTDIHEPFTKAFVEYESRGALVFAYQKAIESYVGSCIEVTWNKKDGEKVKTKVILVPFLVNGNVFALHFVSLITSLS